MTTPEETILEAVCGQPRPVVLIDGRSGSGKSTLALSLQADLPRAQLVRLDDLYPGWDGLEAGSRIVAERVLATSDPHWIRWDWGSGGEAERHELDPMAPLIIEGSGALSRANRALATFGVWVEREDGARKTAALSRDGESYAENWDRWAKQEEAFIASENPQRLADLVIFR